MLEELKEQYRNSLPDKVRAIRELLQEYRGGKTAAIDRLRLVAHSLHGSGSTFGFPEISVAARKVEHAMPGSLLQDLSVLIKVLLDAAAQQPIRDPSLRNILLVEDDAAIANLLKVLVSQRSTSFRVMIAATAEEARRLLERHSLALVVLDLVLPDSDGRNLLRHIRATSAAVPVFILSGVANAAIREECLGLGATSFFSKPFDADTLATAITDALVPSDPVVPAAPEQPPAAPVAETFNAGLRRGASLRILVAEDDELLVGIIRHRLTREGFVVEHVGDGAAALAALAQGDFGLVILDVKMPVMDGFEVLTKIRAHAGTASIPVIMLTAMGSEKDVVRGYDSGADDYIVKPFSPVELLARVKSLLKPG